MSKLLASVKGGKVKLSADLKFLKAEFSNDLDFSTDEIPLYQLVKKAIDKLTLSGWKKKEIVIILDELELAFGTADQYARDCRLVRDLIVVVERLNRLFVKTKFPVQIYCGVRTEVVRSVETLGKEVNKAVDDFGIELRWNQRNLTDAQQPLVKMVLRRLAAAEWLAGKNIDVQVSWDAYFSTMLKGVDGMQFILNSTFYRPRDFVRFFSICRKICPEHTTVDDYVVDSVMKEYGLSTLSEIFEELQAKYSREDIRAIRSCLRGTSEVTWELFKRKFADRSKDDKDVRLLISRHSVNDIADDLFRTGVIGNVYNDRSSVYKRKRFRFAFRGDDEFDRQQRVMIHRGLWRALGVA